MEVYEIQLHSKQRGCSHFPRSTQQLQMMATEAKASVLNLQCQCAAAGDGFDEDEITYPEKGKGRLIDLRYNLDGKCNPNTGIANDKRIPKPCKSNTKQILTTDGMKEKQTKRESTSVKCGSNEMPKTCRRRVPGARKTYEVRSNEIPKRQRRRIPEKRKTCEC
ncbi:unnamed protein product [Gongylonema pulchrum]|uniref:Uncharacterized protein n=1 Tax=Gongylonema pulchrum TaxID=637853 RepID=A0A183E8K4_9BILA|nr:unnamed protein product [Gongylonema pulchrum]